MTDRHEKRDTMYIAIDTDTNKYYTDKDTYRLKNIQSYSTDIYVNILTIAVYRELRFTMRHVV